MSAQTVASLGIAATFEQADVVHSWSLDGHEVEVHVSAQGVWVSIAWSDGHRVVQRGAVCPAGQLTIVHLHHNGNGCVIEADSSLGRWTVEITAHDPAASAPSAAVVRCRSTLRPSAELRVSGWPRDLVVLGRPDGSSTQGVVHAHQVGPRTGLVLASLRGGGAGSFLYLQDLTQLNDYCETTGCSAVDVVGGTWPELGMELPGGEGTLPAGRDVVVGDAYLAISDDICADSFATARLFLDLLAATYLHLPPFATHYVDWPSTAERVHDDLSKLDDERCWNREGSHNYLRAYVSDQSSPPESMVQLAVLLPLLEYEQWCGSEGRLSAALRDTLPTFWDDRIGSVNRWLRAQEELLDGSEDHKVPLVADSWYLYHPLLNLSRLALRGDAVARKLFLDSLGYVMKTAHHFDYHWPILYRQDSLEVLRREAGSGRDGETDVAGMHAHVMLQAYELTKDSQYLEEAITAGRALIGEGFAPAYQLNTTAFGAGAMLRLWQETGERQFLDQSIVSIADVFLNIWMWNCNYGNARHYPTYFCMCPMPDAPYASAYEELEVAAALVDYLSRDIDDMPQSLRILIPEMLRCLLLKGESIYPSQLPPDIVAEQQQSGTIDRTLWVPLEDMRDGRDQSGQVGQEIYGAGAPFQMVVRNWWRLAGVPMTVHVGYPIADQAEEPGSFRFHVVGDPRLGCRLRLMPDAGSASTELPTGLRVMVTTAEGSEEIPPSFHDGESREHWISGDSDITITWQP